MKRTKLLLCILAILATVLFAGCSLADGTPELDFTIPESIDYGMPIPISGISASNTDGYIDVYIENTQMTQIYPEDGVWPDSIKLYGESVFRYTVKAAGRYDVSLKWRREDGTNVTVKKNILLTQGEPATTDPTICSANSSGVNTSEFYFGESVTLYGKSGGATKLYLYFTTTSWEEPYAVISADADGNWSYTMENPNHYPNMKFYLLGYIGDAGEGRYTGRSEYCDCYFFDPENEPDTASVTVTNINYTTADLEIINPNPEKYNIFSWAVLNPDGEVLYTGGQEMYDYDTVYTPYVHLNYRGEYILETLLHNYSGDYTKPVRTPVTVTEGNTYPVNGYQPIYITLPETWEARKDMTITWEPSVPNQNISFSISWQPPELTYYTDTNARVEGEGTERTIPGYGLLPGDYWLNVTVTADTYQETERRFYFTITENSETPAAPVLSEIQGQTWPECDMQFVLTEPWTAAYAELRNPNGGRASSQEITNSDHFTMYVYDEGTYDLYACGEQNGTWSEMAKIGEVEVTAAPTVSQITAYPPETLRYGVEYKIPVLVPGDDSYIYWRIYPAAGGEAIYTTNTYVYGTFTNIYIDEMTLNRYADAPGNYELEFEYGGRTVRYPLTVIGEKPVLLTAEAEAELVSAGDTIRITGTAGSAYRIVLDAEAYGESHYHFLDETVNPAIAGDGTWEYTVTASRPGRYSFYVRGYTEDGRVTGYTNIYVLVPDENSSQNLHMEAGTDPDDGTVIRLTLSADGMNGYTEWMYFITGPDGEIYTTGNTYGYESENGVATAGNYTRYRGTYTVSAYVKKEGTYGIFTGPVTQTVTVTEGRPWPVNGPAPSGLTIPETWLAGVELNLEWAPVIETHSIDIQVYQGNNNLLGYQSDKPRVFEIGILEEGVYRFRVMAEADTYAYSETEYTLTVVENPNRPAEPVLTLPEQTIYPRSAFTVQLDQAYDEVEGYLTVEDSGGYSCDFELKGDQVRVTSYWLPDYDEFTLFLRVKQNGAWSRYSSLQIITEEIPEVEEITFLDVPESVRFGEAFEVGIIFPDDGEGFNNPFDYTITDPTDGSEITSSSPWLNGISYYALSFDNAALNNWLNGPGTYEVRIEYGSHTATFQLHVIGDRPEAPTVSTESSFTEIGETIRITGTAGSADILDIYYDENGQRVFLGHPDITAGGAWNYDIPAASSGPHYVYVYGYTSEGLYTGFNGATVIVPDKNSTAVPQITLNLDPDDAQRVELELTAPGEWNYAQWWFALTGPDGKDLWFRSEWAYDGDSYETSFYPEYQGTYTLTACYRAEYPDGPDVFSRTASATVTITEGRPWPVNGPAPTGLDEIPTTIRAGEEFILNWTPVNGTHEISLTTYRDGTYIDSTGRYYTGGTFNFHFEEEGNYEIWVWSRADTYENFSAKYSLTVTANPDQPDPPEMTLADENVYCQVPFTVQLDDEYEDAECFITVETPGNLSCDPVDCTLNGSLLRTQTNGGTHILEAGKFTLSVSVKKNGIWSKKASIEITLTDLPEVTEITMFSMPEILHRGEDLKVTILLPGEAGDVEVALLNAAKEQWAWGNTWFEGNIVNWSFEGYILTNNNCEEGRYYIRIVWNGQTKEWPFTLVGEEPELLTMDPIPTDLHTGSSVTLTGRTGDEDRIRVTYEDENHWYQKDATINGDGTWSCELVYLQAGKYYLNIYGYNGSLYTGTYRSSFFVSDETSLVKPSLVSSQGSNRVYVTMTPGQDMTGKTVKWHIQYQDEHGKHYSSDYYRTSGNDPYVLSIYDQYTNTYTVTAVYEADGVYSVPEQVVIHMSGKDWPVNGETWEAGRDLQIDWTPEAPGQWVNFWVRNQATDQYVYSRYTQTAETFTIDGYLLESGTYTVYFTTEANTYEQVNKRYSLEVTENANRPAGPSVSVEPDAPTESSVVHLKLDRSYSKVGAVISKDGSSQYPGTQTDTADYRCGSYSAGEWEAKVYVLENGVWSQPGTVVLNIQENPSLNTPEFDPSNPDTIEIGNPLPLKVTGIDPNAKRIRIEIIKFYESDSWDYLYNYTEILKNTGTYTAEIPEYVFEEAGTYSLMIETEGKGYRNVSIDKAFTVTGERPAAPTVRLSATTAAFGDTVYVTVLASGATQAEGARIETPGNFDPSIGIFGMTNGRVRIPINAMGEGDYHFRVFIDGKWSKWSNAVWINSDEPDMIDSNLFHVTFPESITAGEDTAIIIEPIDGIDIYGIDISCWMNGADELQEHSYYSMYDVGTGSITIPGIYFKPDSRVSITVYAGDEMYNYRVWKEKTLTVSAGSAGTQLTISADKTHYAYRAPITISLGGIQAEKVLIRNYNESIYEGDDTWSIWETVEAAPGETLTEINLSYWGTGEIRLQAAALVNGTWTDWSDTLVIQVDEPEGILAKVQSNVEIIGGVPHVTWNAVEHAETYTVYWWPVSSSGYNTRSADLQGVTSFDITEGISRGVCYQICVVPNANKYTTNSRPIYWVVYIEDESPIENILTLPAALTEIEEEAFAGIGAEKVVIPASCGTVSANAFAGSSSLREAEVKGMNTVVHPAAFTGCGTVVVYVLPGSAAEASLAEATNVELRYSEN